jgi:hypothetical protein
MNPQDELREEVVKEIYRIIEAEQDVVDKANNILLLIQREKARVAWEVYNAVKDEYKQRFGTTQATMLMVARSAASKYGEETKV